MKPSIIEKWKTFIISGDITGHITVAGVKGGDLLGNHWTASQFARAEPRPAASGVFQKFNALCQNGLTVQSKLILFNAYCY